MSTITWSASVCQYIILFSGGTSATFVTTPSLESPQLSEVKPVQGGEQLSAANYPIIQDDSFPSWNFHELLSESAFMYSDRQGKPSPVVCPWFVDLHHDRRSCMSTCAVKRRRLSVTHDTLAGAASLACRAHRSHVMPICHVASVDGNMRSGR